jgi:PAS domain S-box-containing protein
MARTPPPLSPVPPQRLPVGLRWLVAAAGVAAGTGIRLALDPLLPPGFPYLTYFPLILLVTVFAGRIQAAVAALAGMGIAWGMFADPRGDFPTDWPTLVSLAVYLFVNGTGIAIVDRLATLTRDLAYERDRSQQLVTERAHAAVEAWESRERLDALIWQMPVGIVEADLTGRLRFVNGRAAQLLGRSATELPGLSATDLVHIADHAALVAALDRLIAGGRPETLALRPAFPGRPGLLLHLALARDPESRPQAVMLAIEARPADHGR